MCYVSGRVKWKRECWRQTLRLLEVRGGSSARSGRSSEEEASLYIVVPLLIYRISTVSDTKEESEKFLLFRRVCAKECLNYGINRQIRVPGRRRCDNTHGGGGLVPAIPGCAVDGEREHQEESQLEKASQAPDLRRRRQWR